MNTQDIRRNYNALLLMLNNSIKDIPTTTAGNLLTPVPSSDRRETKKKVLVGGNNLNLSLESQKPRNIVALHVHICTNKMIITVNI